MKPATTLLALSLVANAALAAVFAFKPALAPPAVRDWFTRGPAEETAVEAGAATSSSSATAHAASPAAAAADRIPDKFWSTLDSDDLPTLIAHLRAAGLPPHLIRAVVNAKIEKLMRPRAEALAASLSNTPFWKPDPRSSINNPGFFEQYNQLYRDRSRLLRQVLGDAAFAGTGAEDFQQRRYGGIPKAKIDLVERIEADYSEMNSQLRAAQQGIILPEDREKMALLEREKRADLAAALTRQELAEYDLRTSPITSRLRTPLTFMDATEDEFRSLYEIQRKYSDRLYPTAGMVPSPEMMAQRTAATQEMYAEIKNALGETRFADYARASNSEYQQLYRLAQRDNIATDVVVRTYNLRDSAAAESGRIAADPSLTTAEKRAAIQAIAQTTKAQITAALGPTTGNTYAQVARWLPMLERGTPISIGIDGQVSSRSLPTTSAPPTK
jgi:hypothetical protein